MARKERAVSHQTTRLGVGKHEAPGPVVCVMELASMLAGERFSDRPASVCPIVGSILRIYNDNIRGEQRDDLYRYAAEAVGTRGDFRLQLRRATLALAWAKGQNARRRLHRRGPAAPTADAGPDLIAEYVFGSVSRRVRSRCPAEVHTSMLWLLDELIALGASNASLPPRADARLDSRASAETPVAARPAAAEVMAERAVAVSPVAEMAARAGAETAVAASPAAAELQLA
jgi:hypothetical protein